LRRETVRIFLGEDDAADVYLIRQALTTAKVECTLDVASHGGEMLDLLISQALQPPALIILDLNLPRHDGLEILHFIKSEKRYEEVPVMILTSSDSPRDRQTAIAAGADSYVRKPSTLGDFLVVGNIIKELIIGKVPRPVP
jgi:CheY-like chemotaxis protein